ncbi:MAG: formyltetrahydrofolate deformylase [Alphaproteobacteria bacterium]|nr:MAG: formyltetrahydrofolate deformylase [Caulobacteraceae bacterium]TPW04139.1 MAG: formyltetrahydrofolate deformylase [Alphaproteobacteria bacterium]
MTLFVLILKCPDRRGVVAATSGFLAKHFVSITESNHFNDDANDLFYMRTEFRADAGSVVDINSLALAFSPIATEFEMQWSFHDLGVKPRILIAVSKQGHCLYDLLHRWRSGLLPVNIAAVISNHEEMRSFVEWSRIPYHHLPVSRETRSAQEMRIRTLIADLEIDLVVLARYMQVLSPELCAELSGRCINIHHSFLPSFKGASPYNQAYDRGVKIIGATAHYVTSDLDEGPIIEQGVERITHAHSPRDLIEIGRDVECAVLARSVRWHVERRILINGNKTVVFN